MQDFSFEKTAKNIFKKQREIKKAVASREKPWYNSRKAAIETVKKRLCRFLTKGLQPTARTNGAPVAHHSHTS